MTIHRSASRVASLLLLIALCQASPARARVDNTARATARQHFARGKRLFIQKRYVKAAAAFERALRHWRHHSVLFNLALAWALAGKPVRAIRALREYLTLTKRSFSRLPDLLREAREKVVVLQINVGHPPGAEIYVDGRLAGRGRAEVVVPPGSRVIEIRQENQVLRRRLVRLQAGDTRILEIELPRSGRRVGGKPPVLPPPRPGTRPVVPSAEAKQHPVARVHWAGFATATALTLAGLAGAVALSVKTKQLHDEFETRRWDEELATRGSNYQRATNALWGVTAAAAVGTALLAIFTRWSSRRLERPGALFLPTLHPGGAGLVARLPLGF